MAPGIIAAATRHLRARRPDPFLAPGARPRVPLEAMIVGAMNHPARDPLHEMEWMAEAGFQFIDLTIEPPGAMAAGLKPAALRARAQSLGLTILGHTFWGLPIGSVIPRVRRAAVDQLGEDLELLAELGVPGATIHPDSRLPRSFSAKEMVAYNLESLQVLAEQAQTLGLGLWIENVPGPFTQPRILKLLMQQLPQAGLTLDVGHAHLVPEGSLLPGLLKSFGGRLAHVHLSDNKGGSHDLHLPLGSGGIDWPSIVTALKERGYDGTITLEVFTDDLDYRVFSRHKFLQWWDAARPHP